MSIVYIFVTSGAEYTCSHTVVELRERKKEFIIADGFCDSNLKALDGIKEIA